MATFLTGDEALDSARADVLHNDQQRAAPALPGSAAAASVAASGSRSFWKEATLPLESRRLELEQLPAGQEDANPRAVESGESRLCFAFINKGRCARADCTFRHLSPSHPDAIANAAKRAQVGWQPPRAKQRKMGE